MAEDDFDILIEAQRRELMAIRNLESDLDFAYRLQMEEAMAASLALQPSTSSANPTPLMEASDSNLSSDISKVSDLLTLELDKFQQEQKDREQCQAEMRRIKNDIKLRVHDQKFAEEVISVPEDEWEKFGDYLAKPFGEGSSSGSSSSGVGCDEPFRLYFKGLISEEKVKNANVTLSAIGVAVCDPKDNLILKIQKPLIGDWKNHRAVELRALIEGLNAALTLDIKRINYYCINRTSYLQITGRWRVKQRKLATLLDQVFLLQRKFKRCQPLLVAGKDVKFAFKFAREAIDSQVTKSLESTDAKNFNEICCICYEDTDVSKMFAVDGCLHRYCFSCMKQHMEVKVQHGMIPACPHEGCKTELSLDTARKFLPLKLVETMGQLIKEASVPVTEKVYCPYPKCSTLMSKSEVLDYTNNVFTEANRSGVRKCLKCHGLFCINCKIPWHKNMTCNEYKTSNVSSHAEEAKLKSLATQKLWRQCVKCNHMIELAEGCFHMTCRCGYEFCYTCGAEWKNKNQTCSCPLWIEENILYDHEEDFFDDEDFDDDYDSDEFDEFDGFGVGWDYFMGVR